jgi:hypothetical protein
MVDKKPRGFLEQKLRFILTMNLLSIASLAV